MKKIYLFLLCVLAGFFSCVSENEWLNSFPALDDEQYAFYVADALDAMNMSRPEGSYNYPCLPGMPAWNDLKSSEEMEQICRVPEKILKKQSTQAVIQAMWEHPDFSMLIVSSNHSSIQISLDRVLPDWDIYIELIKRSDAASCLVERYYRMNLKKTIHGFYNNSLQLLLSQTVFLDQLPLKEKIQLAKEIVNRIGVINKIEGTETGHDAYCNESAYFCLVRIMVNSDYVPMSIWVEEDAHVRDFVSLGSSEFMETSSFRAKILDLSSNFINGN